MDQFLTRLLLLEESILMLIFLGLIVLGGLFGHKVLVEGPVLRRTTYVLAISVIGLALSVSHIGWMLVEAAAKAGFFSGAIMLLLSAYFFFGLGVYYVSPARSRHITGNRSKAWLGFIPIANLWLVFKSGGADIVRRPGAAAAHLLGNIALIILALIFLAASKGLDFVVDQ